MAQKQNKCSEPQKGASRMKNPVFFKQPKQHRLSQPEQPEAENGIVRFASFRQAWIIHVMKILCCTSVNLNPLLKELDPVVLTHHTPASCEWLAWDQQSCVKNSVKLEELSEERRFCNSGCEHVSSSVNVARKTFLATLKEVVCIHCLSILSKKGN